MTNCACNLLRGIVSFLLGSLRLILFFGCLLSVFIQIAHVFIVFNVSYDNDLQLPHTRADSSDAIYAVFGLLLAGLGCYGSFYKHHRSIKLFALLTALSIAFMIIIILYSMSPDDLHKDNERFAMRMNRLAKNYSWSLNEPLYGESEANRAWNKLQRLQCCGLKGPDDWKKNRPGKVADDLYPSSCCALSLLETKTTYCEKEVVFTVGCMERIHQLDELNLVITYIYIAYQLCLCILAYVVGNFNLDRSNQTRTTGEVGNNNRSNYRLPAEYQRFEGSVYVRQPPVNEQHHHVTKSDLPPLYPNVHEIERATYFAPPPSYGTSN